MSTVNVSDQLFQRTFEVAVAQGKTVDEFVAETLQQAVGGAASPVVVIGQTMRNDLPVMMVGEGVPRIDPAKIREAIEEEGF
jgi:hypothetical protein